MEKSYHSSSGGGGGGESTVTTITTTTATTSNATTATSSITTSSNSTNNSNNNRDVYLKHLNKISHKISKPIRRPTGIDQNHLENPPSQHPQTQVGEAPINQSQQQQQQQQQHQPPVYNINKDDFRDVVQRLTGSPAHERFSTPPPIQPPKPPSSRLQRIRPPPLAQISNRPPPLPQINYPATNMLNYAARMNNAGGGATTSGFFGGQRQPLSPLPPFPAVHAAAESPISAYMRFLQSSVSSAASPRWNNLPHPQLPPPSLQQQNIPPLPQASVGLPQFPLLPTSPLPFGCVPSPKSPYAMLSPSLLFSPVGQLGFQQLPLSPTLPVSSPRWKGI